MSTVQTQGGGGGGEDFEGAKKQIRGLVGEIAQLGKSDLEPEEFYAAFLQRVVQALAAAGGAVWILGEGRRPQLSYQINLNGTLLDPESEDANRHARLLDMVVNTNQPQLIPPLSGNEQGGNPTRNLLVIAPLGHDKNVEGLIEIFQRPNTQTNTQRGYLKFLVQMCELASDWFKNRKLRQFSDRHSLWAQSDQFARLVHDTLDYRETAYTIVNEGRRLIGCDRVSVCTTRGGKCTVEAISGQDTMDNRSNVVYHLSQLASKVIASGETLWYTGSTENMPPQIEKTLEAYVDESYTKSMVVMPIRKPRAGDDHILNPEEADRTPREIIGALIIEQLESDVPREVLDPRIDLVYEHAARALSNTIDHHSLFMMPVWKAIGKSTVVVQGRNLPKTLMITGLVLAGLLASVLIPVPWTLKSKGALQPIEKREVFARQPGTIESVLRDDGAVIEPNETLIVMSNNQLNIEQKDLQGRLNVVTGQLSSLNTILLGNKMDKASSEKPQLEKQKAEYEQERISLENQLKIKNEQIADMKINSPLTTRGQVITWDAKENLERRSVQQGEVLLSVANLEGGWQVELYVPERRAGKVKRRFQEMAAKNEKVKVSFKLMTDPDKSITGTIREIEESTFAHAEDGPCVRMKIDIDPAFKEKIVPRPNAAVTASVENGYCSLANAFLHEAWEYLQLNWLFW
jgi:HlyD family secretion protein/GAF domain